MERKRIEKQLQKECLSKLLENIKKEKQQNKNIVNQKAEKIESLDQILNVEVPYLIHDKYSPKIKTQGSDENTNSGINNYNNILDKQSENFSDENGLDDNNNDDDCILYDKNCDNEGAQNKKQITLEDLKIIDRYSGGDGIGAFSFFVIPIPQIIVVCSDRQDITFWNIYGELLGKMNTGFSFQSLFFIILLITSFFFRIK
jgi:hypothetical protein